MTFAFTLAWWVIPTVITVLGLIWALFIVDSGSGMLAGFSNLLALIPVLLVSAIAWSVAGAFK